MAPLALVAKLASRWRHLHELQIWPQYGTIVVFLNFRFAIFLEIRFVFLWVSILSFVAKCFKIWSSGEITCIAMHCLVPKLVRTQGSRSESQPGDEWGHFGLRWWWWSCTWTWSQRCAWTRPTSLKDTKIRTQVDKLCSLWLFNLEWDALLFVNFRFPVFLKISFVFHSHACSDFLL